MRQQEADSEARIGVNVPAILRTIESIAREKSAAFYMGTWCGTACCIGGHTLLANGMNASEVGPEDIPYLAKQLLRIDDNQALELFQPSDIKGATDDYIKIEYPKERAIAVLRNLIATGEVDWSVAA